MICEFCKLMILEDKMERVIYKLEKINIELKRINKYVIFRQRDN